MESFESVITKLKHVSELSGSLIFKMQEPWTFECFWTSVVPQVRNEGLDLRCFRIGLCMLMVSQAGDEAAG
jgi:hypothetical protein